MGRARDPVPAARQPQSMKRDGQHQEVKFDIATRTRVLCDGLDAACVDSVPITQKVVEGFFNGITTREIDTLAAEPCAYMSKRPGFSTLSACIAVSTLHKNTSESIFETCRLLYE